MSQALFNAVFAFAMYLLGMVVGYYLLPIGFGENYIYNASESEIQDQWVTETCIRLQINSPECDMVYGGIMDKPSDGRLK